MLNQVIIEGRCTADIELKTTKSNQAVVVFNIANENTKDKVDFFSCEAWGKLAEHISKYFKKGSGIEIVGKLTIRKYTKKDGTEAEKTSIVVEKVSFPLGSKPVEHAEVDDSDCPY